MATKQDSSVTGLRIAEELTIGVLPGSPVWDPYEPNSYGDFGGQNTTVAREPINEGRQRQKGVVTDQEAAGAFNQDFTQKNFRDVLQGYLFASWAEQPDELVTDVNTTTDDYTVADETGFQVGNLILAENFANAANNGLKTVDTVSAGVVSVSENLVTNASPPATAHIKVVGFQGVAGDIDVDVPGGGALNAYTSTALDFTTLGLFPGAWIYVGGDVAALAFLDANNNGFKRVVTIAAGRLEVDRGGESMTTEASTTETIQLFLPDTLKNQNLAVNQVRRTYQLERTLGDNGSGVQSQYEIGGVPSTFVMTVGTADKIAVDAAFLPLSEEVRDGATGVKTGTRPTLVSEGAFNTSTDVRRAKIVKNSDGSDLVGFLTEFTLSIDNSLSANKAISVTGAFEVTAGNLVVTANSTGYFTDVAAQVSLLANDDTSFMFALAKNNAGWTFDLPLLTLGDGRLNVEKDAPITIPLSVDAGEDPTTGFNHTILINSFDYLPTAAG